MDARMANLKIVRDNSAKQPDDIDYCIAAQRMSERLGIQPYPE
jgi:hypothetical protein